MTEEIMQAAMKIILNAGDARNECMQALTAIENGDFVLAEEKMECAHKNIILAHKVQTDAIQGEASGEKESEYSLLFSHAQDTLMTVYSEINIAKHLIKIFKAYEQRLAKIEKDKMN